ncbi:hypothetical protein Fcan01_00558 [Folsomia candida]|uniref:Uncharacterized protein n=1 Tax=Folsomia candida TaxID=158441 RepID=A0A226F3C0_FOLCA|nr:hypothetical protein Fcan01_00558 [Folsomia candida]
MFFMIVSIVGFLAPFIIPTIFQISGSNPYHVTLCASIADFLHPKVTWSLNCALFLLGSATLFIVIFEIARLWSQVSIFGMLAFSNFSNALSTCFDVNCGMLRVRNLKLYRELVILVEHWCFEFLLNSLLFYVVATLRFTISCNFIVLRVRPLLPIYTWIVFIAFAVPTYLTIVGITPRFSRIGEDSEEWLRKWRIFARKGTLLKKMVASLKPIVLHGGFGRNKMIVFDKEMKCGYYKAILENTIMASLSINV